MIVAGIGIVIVIKGARRLTAARSAALDREPAGHAKMHRQPKPAPGFRDDVLRAARQADHAFVLQARSKIRLEGKAQIRAIKRDGGKRCALHGRGKATPHDLDFRKLGHAAKFARMTAFGKRGSREAIKARL